MTRKKRRMTIVILGMLTLGAATALVLTAFEDSVVFFYSPTEAAENKPPPGSLFRIGGIVVMNSVAKDADGLTTRFRVTDTANTIEVAYKGVLPDLFREGQGIVAQGRMEPGGIFRASEVLAKHDETYMPKEVADALKKSGKWRGEDARK